MANVTAALRATGRWDDALLVVSSDNGGIGPGNNFPQVQQLPCVFFRSLKEELLHRLRGSKVSPWQGGTQVTAFVTGGFIPPSLRGTSNAAIMHVAE